jgi:hypothetical protein
MLVNTTIEIPAHAGRVINLRILISFAESIAEQCCLQLNSCVHGAYGIYVTFCYVHFVEA